VGKGRTDHSVSDVEAEKVGCWHFTPVVAFWG